MARPRSDDKRNAILSAAIDVLAERGLAATPTSAVSRAAGVAEGTLFTYFSTKDELVNVVYRELKQELADTLMSSLPRTADCRSKLQHIWNGYVNWGAANPAKFQVMAQLRVAAQITEESHAIGYAPFAEVEQMGKDAIRDKVLRDYPMPFIAATMQSLAETTMAFMVQEPSAAARYRKSGFEVFWNGIAHP
jgi:AcrR family transcriptional regulator